MSHQKPLNEITDPDEWVARYETMTIPPAADRDTRHRLIAFYDSLDELPAPAYSVLWAQDHPLAAEMARLWASSRDYKIDEHVSEAGHSLCVLRRNHTLFTVRLDSYSVTP